MMTTTTQRTTQVTQEFIKKYELAWSKGLKDLIELYAPECILVGYQTVQGRHQISELLQGIMEQGWTSISIKPILNKPLNSSCILLACEYTAIASPELNAQQMTAKSSYVLIRENGEWLIAMHTAP
ncbi:hypothetical protein [Pedobacter sp. NJ-S-72]